VAIRTLDLFAGVGGSSEGARKAGARIVAAIDAWPLATEAFRDNFPSARVITKRLEKVQVNVLRSQIGKIDLLLASPECTNHTCAKGSAKRSEASRETALEVLRFARAFKPRWIVIENVTQMRQWRRYRTFRASIESLGYAIREQVLNAKNFGVPQDRKRLFILCDREGQPPKVVPDPGRKPKSVRHILDGNGEWKFTALLEERRADSTVARYCNGLARLGENRSFLLVYYGTDAGGGWQHLDRPLRTITTVDRFALVTPNRGNPKMRMLQVPELQRAMGFRASYRLNGGSRRDRIRLLGNAVCPPVMAYVVRTLTKASAKGR
jgi:DNA (cytosine-5)-methyltransferase 1